MRSILFITCLFALLFTDALGNTPPQRIEEPVTHYPMSPYIDVIEGRRCKWSEIGVMGPYVNPWSLPWPKSSAIAAVCGNKVGVCIIGAVGVYPCTDIERNTTATTDNFMRYDVALKFTNSMRWSVIIEEVLILILHGWKKADDPQKPFLSASEYEWVEAMAGSVGNGIFQYVGKESDIILYNVNGRLVLMVNGEKKFDRTVSRAEFAHIANKFKSSVFHPTRTANKA
jgi:hypothetical protein